VRELILVLAVVVGAAATMLGPLLAIVLIGWSFLGWDADGKAIAGTTSIALGIAAIGMGMGLALIWAGWRALHLAEARPFRLGRWWVWLVTLGAVLLVGQGLMLAGLDVALPLFQVAAAALPPFLFLSMALDAAGGTLADLTQGRALGSLAWGGLVGAGLSLLLELGLVAAGLAVMAAGIRLFDPARAIALWRGLQDAALAGVTPDARQLIGVVPWPLLTVGVLGLLGMAGPLVEELLKAGAVPVVVAAGGRPGRLSGFLLGAAAGAGFAIVEGVLNGAPALGLGALWAGLMIFRGAAAAMHCLASGLMGLGWQMFLVERRRLAGIGLGLLAFGLHSAWNTSVGIIGLNSLWTTESVGAAALARIGVSSVLALFLMFLCMIVVAGLALIPMRLGER